MIDAMERRVLTSICQATNSSKSAHVPKPYFMKKFQQDKRTKKAAEKALVSLIAHGYVSLHKTRNEMTYQLTDIGLDVCREIFQKFGKGIKLL
ncbi:MAG TPA: hypothetical protein PKK11_02115 [Methanothrix sp.]|nr:hypothetical protein [Methanothrix sp.]HPT19323.1 hypothetical protein [Methanothrix sp.]